MRRLRPLVQRPWTLLPNGPVDASRQILTFGGVYVLYQLVRGLVDRNDIGLAYGNAAHVIGFEQRLGVFVEPAVQRWALHMHWLMVICTWLYLNVNYAITGVALLWIYLRRNESFGFLRNTFVAAMLLALLGYALFPTAPPRLMTAWGFTDVVQQVTGVSAQRGAPAAFLNLYAAIPSMHVCFAVLTGIPLARLVRHRIVRVAWLLYPLLIVFVVVATGNHYLVDVVLGGATGGVAALFAARLGRLRPEAWSFGPAGLSAAGGPGAAALDAGPTGLGTGRRTHGSTGAATATHANHGTHYAVGVDGGANPPRTSSTATPYPPTR